MIASGGVGTLEHLADGLVEGGADAVLAASIFHFGEHTIGEAKAFLAGARASPCEVDRPLEPTCDERGLVPASCRTRRPARCSWSPG